MTTPADTYYRKVFEYSSNPIGLVKDGVFIDCNQAMLGMFALEHKDEAIGNRVGSLFAPPEQPDGEDSPTKAKRYLQRCIEEGHLFIPWTSRRVDGGLLSTHVLLQALDDSESPTIMVYIHDMTAQKAGAQGAPDREDYLLELLECSPVANLVCDLESGLISRVNRAGRLLLDLPDGGLHEIRVHDLLANPSDRLRFLRRLMTAGEAHGELVLKRPGGSLVHAQVTLRFNPGNDTELLFWAVDISKSKRIERALEQSRNEALQANEAKSQFLSRMSHELRTPLNAILGFGQVLQMNSENLTDDQSAAVEHILSGGAQLLELIKDVLDFSHASSDDSRMDIRRISTHSILQRSIDVIRPLAEDAGVSLTGPDHAPPDVLADSRWLGQVMIHLLSNATKFNHRGGSVTVRSEATSDGMLRIHVKDSGEGIAPQHRHLVFKPFERFSTTRPEVAGTGVGLALCKQLIKLMGGSIGFESEPGVGSDFWIELRTADGLADGLADKWADTRSG